MGAALRKILQSPNESFVSLSVHQARSAPVHCLCVFSALAGSSCSAPMLAAPARRTRKLLNFWAPWQRALPSHAPMHLLAPTRVRTDESATESCRGLSSTPPHDRATLPAGLEQSEYARTHRVIQAALSIGFCPIDIRKYRMLGIFREDTLIPVRSPTSHAPFCAAMYFPSTHASGILLRGVSRICWPKYHARRSIHRSLAGAAHPDDVA